ncbi:MAG: TrkH family potassium uptake protein [Candidatus Aminicenantes bacterium]|nr:TrkH family potassium uptake protein [Candidatus Aminicenantes bacterium]
MNFRAVVAIQGLLLVFQGLFMVLPLGFSLYYGDDDVIPILISAGITLAVISIRVDGQPVPPTVVINILGFIFLYIVIFAVASIAMSLLGLDFDSAFSSVAATLGNVGPGLGVVGPAAHYFHVPMIGKWILAFCMLAGRLEIYTVLVLFTRGFWK